MLSSIAMPCTLSHLCSCFLIDMTSEKRIVYKGYKTNWNLDSHGIRLHIPEDALPPDVFEISVTITCSTCCEYALPANTELVSGVYTCLSSHHFTKPVLLEIEHSCLLESPSDAKGLVFGRCSKNEPPYDFEIMKDGTFKENYNFGMIALHNFSIYAIFQYLLSYIAPTRYCASLYYSEDRENYHSWYVYLVITKDTRIAKQVHHIQS